MPKNALYAQSGGVTAVINATACGVIQTAAAHPEAIGQVFAARDGIVGALAEDLIDLSRESPETIAALRHTPGGAFGSCRFDLGRFESHRHQYERLIEVFAAHDIGYFFYNGGGGSMLTAHKVSQIGDALDYPLTTVGIPKTIDNDLAVTDCSPGFGSAAKWVATSVREAALDVASMAATSTKVFILEVMGRHGGWLAAAGGLAGEGADQPPHLILFAERPFDQARFLERVRETIARVGYCVIVAAEGLKDEHGEFLSIMHESDVYAWIQLGGVAPNLAELVKRELGVKVHWAVADYLQRSARHLASKTDVEQAYAVGRAAVEAAIGEHHAVMPVIRRLADAPYAWDIGLIELDEVADIEHHVPDEFISEDGFGITAAARRYLQPLIQGEDYPPYRDGLPDYARLRGVRVRKRLPDFDIDA